MYNYYIYADIKIVLIAILISYVLIIFPIFININARFSLEEKRVYYDIKIFKIIKLFYGYIEKLDDGIIIHLNKKKAILIPYSNFLDVRNKVKPLKDYHLIKYQAILEIGNRDNLINTFSLSFIYKFISEFFAWFLYHKKPYFKFNNVINLYDDKDVLTYKINATILLNLLMILISIIKISVEKIYYAIRKKIRQN